MMFGYGSGWPTWGIALMWIGMLVFLAFLIWAAYALITSTSGLPVRTRARGPAARLAFSAGGAPAARSTPRSTGGSAT